MPHPPQQGEYEGLLEIEWLRGLTFLPTNLCKNLNGKGYMNEEICLVTCRALAPLSCGRMTFIWRDSRVKFCYGINSYLCNHIKRLKHFSLLF